jgi:hypothetical protein
MLRAQRILALAVVSSWIAVPLCSQSVPPVAAAGLPRNQHFACNTGYTHASCHAQMQKLALHLARYREQLPGDWTWALVRSQDWHRILLSLDLDPQSPAFTVLDQRRTFLSEALIAPDAYGGAELLRTFRVPLDRILDVAITHELGHAYCDDKREGEAERFGEQLRRNGAARCAPLHRSSTRNSLATMVTPR